MGNNLGKSPFDDFMDKLNVLFEKPYLLAVVFTILLILGGASGSDWLFLLVFLFEIIVIILKFDMFGIVKKKGRNEGISGKKSPLVTVVEGIDKFFDKVFANTFLTGLVFFPVFIIVFTGDFTVMLLKFFWVVIGVIAYICARKVIMTGEERRKAKIQFFNECEYYDLYDLTQPYQKQKAELLALRLGCKFSDIAEYYAEAMEMAAGNAECNEHRNYADLTDEKLARTRNTVQHTGGINTGFAGYYGRNKRIAILEALQRQYREEAEEMQKTTKFVVRGSQQSEINTGVAGGIASGLFGVVPGIAAAIDAENKNVQIRAQNKANLDALAPGVFAVMNKSYEYEAEADRLQLLIDDAKIKTVAALPDSRVFSFLSVNKQEITATKSGTVTVKAVIQVKAPKEELMLGTAEGVIDGTIAANLYQNGKMVGQVRMLLPPFGVKDQATIEGTAHVEGNSKSLYKVKFEPYHLWLMEE